ncbi:MAG: cupin domain-containing protein [Candidatus Aenigmarchaeota archaeon]|nr:cupin domain-containing protein [Candidatus Aenigmarchaeota archaeon]
MIKKISKSEVKPIESSCGLLRELYKSKDLSISHNIVSEKPRKHLHKKMEEIYYIEKGRGKAEIDGELIDVKKGDIVLIPKNTWHCLKKIGREPLEVLVINSPKYNPIDVILEE